MISAAIAGLAGSLKTLVLGFATLSDVHWSTLGESVTIVTGLIFIVCVLAFRRGIMGELIAWLQGRGKS